MITSSKSVHAKLEPPTCMNSCTTFLHTQLSRLQCQASENADFSLLVCTATLRTQACCSPTMNAYCQLGHHSSITHCIAELCMKTAFHLLACIAQKSRTFPHFRLAPTQPGLHVLSARVPQARSQPFSSHSRLDKTPASSSRFYMSPAGSTRVFGLCWWPRKRYFSLAIKAVRKLGRGLAVSGREKREAREQILFLVRLAAESWEGDPVCFWLASKKP